MEFKFVDTALSVILLAVVLTATYFLTVFGLSLLPGEFESYRPLALASLSLFGFSALSGLASTVLERFIPKSISLDFKFTDTTKIAYLWKLSGFMRLFHLQPVLYTGLIPVSIRFLFYNLVGGDVGGGSIVGGKIVDPGFVKVGKQTILGEDSLIMGHSITSGRVHLSTVDIGNNVTVGARAIIMPGVKIEDGAVVWTGALVTQGTHIKAGENWRGVPARKVDSISS